MQLKSMMAAVAAIGGIAIGLGATSQAGAVALTDLTIVTSCALGDISPAASACTGFYEGNLLNNAGDNKQYQQLALASMGFTWDGSTILEEDTTTDNDVTGFLGQIDFSNNLAGTFFFGIHFGNGQNSPGGGGRFGTDTTAFYKVEGGSGVDFVNLLYNSGSTARLYGVVANDPCVTTPTAPGCGGGETSVPEPGTWALMIMGFGGAGYMLRRRRTVFA